MKGYFSINNQFKKYLPIFLIMLSVIILMGTSYSLLRNSQRGENSYAMNIGVLEVTFQDSETNELTLTDAILMIVISQAPQTNHLHTSHPRIVHI